MCECEWTTNRFQIVAYKSRPSVSNERDVLWLFGLFRLYVRMAKWMDDQTCQDEHRPICYATLDDIDEEISETQEPNVAIRHYELDDVLRWHLGVIRGLFWLVVRRCCSLFVLLLLGSWRSGDAFTDDSWNNCQSLIDCSDYWDVTNLGSSLMSETAAKLITKHQIPDANNVTRHPSCTNSIYNISFS